MEEQEELIQERNEHRRTVKEADMLADLMNQPGFSVLVGIYKTMFEVYFVKLQEADDANARAGIKNLQELFNQIDTKLDLGKDSKEQLSKDIFKNLGNTV